MILNKLYLIILLLVLSVGWYVSHLRNVNQFLELQNKQHKADLEGWLLAYDSLLKENQLGQSLMKKRQEFITSLRNKIDASRKELEILNEELNTVDKACLNSNIPDAVLKFMRDAGSEPTP